MRILIIAPQPYYTERGTPIAVRMLITALLEGGHEIDLLTYHEGEDQPAEGVRIHRIRPILPIRGIPPGPSLKKLFCDAYLFGRARSLLKQGRYDLVHAIEESAIMAAALCRGSGTPFVFDMDSSMATQVADLHALLKPVATLFRRLEYWTIERAHAVIPMCEALKEEYDQKKSGRFFVLHDVSLRHDVTTEIREHVSALDIGAGDDDVKLMYIGNLERYQGIDLLLEGMAVAATTLEKLHLTVIGGKPTDIDHYAAISQRLGVEEIVTFCGPRPVDELGALMERADVLVSPRIEGVNTPMKIYSYMDSNRALLATRLPTHTQVLDESMACLVDPDPTAMAAGIEKLCNSASFRERIAAAAKARAGEKHTYAAFRDRVQELYSRFEFELNAGSA